MIEKKPVKRIDYLNQVKAPFRNKSLKNLEREKWTAIPGLDGLYEVSNYGRVKSLARKIYYTTGKIIHKKESIVLAGVSPVSNYFTGDSTYQLAVHLYCEGKINHYGVGRLVYECFVKPIVETTDKIFIIPKDGNGLNCFYKNLVAVSSGEKQKRIYSSNRNITCFSWLDMKEIAKKNIEARYQPVTQYNQEGKKIATYKSVKAASQATGISRTTISCVINGYWQTAGGYVWKKGNGEKIINLDGYFDQWRKSYKEKRGKKIIQYSLDKKKLNTYPSITDAEKMTGIHFSNISRAVKGELKTAGGFIWKPVRNK